MIEAITLSIPTVRAQAPALAARQPTRRVRIGSLNVGGDAPITAQSMTTTKAHDIGAILRQIAELTVAGCDIVRMAYPTDKDAEVLPIIAKQPRTPVIADTHFNPKYILAAIETGYDMTHINPDNARKLDSQVADICKAASDAGVSLHIGVNTGPLDKRLFKKHGKATPEALVESVTWEAGPFEEDNLHNFKISAKHHDVITTVQAYRFLSETGQWPLRLGVTKAGLTLQGTIKSCITFDTLPVEDIDDTIRISLSAPPVEEIKVGIRLLEFMRLCERQFEIVSRLLCGRTQADVWTLAKKMEAGFRRATAPLRVAAMGRVVSGPDEVREADLGCAPGSGKGRIFVRDQAVGTAPEDQVVETLLKHTEAMVAEMTEELRGEAPASTNPTVSVAG